METDPEKQDMPMDEAAAGNNDLESQTTAPETSEQAEEEDVLESVFSNAERMCCGRGSKGTVEDNVEAGYDPMKNAPSAPETDGERDSERESPNGGYELKRDPSSVKENIEIQAHFDDDEDGLTITSDNGQDAIMEPRFFGMFVNEDDTKSTLQRRRRRILMMFLAWVVLVIFIIGLSVGVSKKHKREAQAASASAATGFTSSASNNTGSGTAIGSGSGTGSTMGAGGGNTAVGGQTTSLPVSAPTGTPVATPAATPAPSVAKLTAAPTACDSISANSTCYKSFQDELTVSFNICNSTSQDWVAIYPQGSGMNNMAYPRLQWSYTCGNQTCNGAVESGTIGMGVATAPGMFQAYLFSNIGGGKGPPYSAVAASAPFQITTGSCN